VEELPYYRQHKERKEISPLGGKQPCVVLLLALSWHHASCTSSLVS
jgi:hypothetical protein